VADLGTQGGDELGYGHAVTDYRASTRHVSETDLGNFTILILVVAVRRTLASRRRILDRTGCAR
jgi:hypothetical protein